jgi:glycerol-3-phosphate acyltransferase PlsY
MAVFKRASNMYLETIIAIITAYLIGSISSAILVCKILHLPDPRTQGSKNPGATNVLRFGGKKAAILTLIGDILKGVIPVLLAKMIGFDITTIALVALAAFLGHLYPIFFRFEGGKGVATACGCIIALSWPAGLTLALIWLIIAILFRYSSLAALVASIAAPFTLWYFSNDTYAMILCVMSALLIYRHTQNIKNLLAGKEKKIGKK